MTSLWLADNLGLESLAKQLNRIDIYTNTVETAKARIVALVDKELAA